MNNKTQDNKVTLQNDTKQSHNKKREKEFANKPASKEVGGRAEGLEPTRYGDWEFKGRCIDF
ncbi:MAG: DUF1674 domain-containing protein [Gammaproteobacteria bacterium]